MKDAKSKKEAKSIRSKPSKEKSNDASKRTLGSLFKIGYLKAVAKMGIIDKSVIEVNFERNMVMFESYHTAVRQMYYGCERMIQPNPQLLQEGTLHDRSPNDNPHMRLITFYDYMKTVGPLDPYLSEDRHIKLFFNKADTTMVNSIIKLGKALWKKEYDNREQVADYMRETSEFLNKYDREYKEKRAVMKDLLLSIDDNGNQIKKAKTMEDLKKCGTVYEDTVNLYNRNAIDITDNWIYNYPKFNYQSQKDLVKFHMARAKYHREAAKEIREWLKKNYYGEVREAYMDKDKNNNDKNTMKTKTPEKEKKEAKSTNEPKSKFMAAGEMSRRQKI